MLSKFVKGCVIWIISTCARHYIHQKKLTVIGVTGSMGKTSCRTIIAAILRHTLPSLHIYTSPKNFNGELGLPLSILCIESYTPHFLSTVYTLGLALYRAYCTQPDYDIIVLEYGIDHPGEMQDMLDIVIPDIAVWTGLDYVHISQFDGIQQIASEKAKLVLSAKKMAFVACDHPLCESYIDDIDVDLVRFAIDSKKSDIQIAIQDVMFQDRIYQTSLCARYADTSYSIQSNLILKHDLIYASLACVMSDVLAYHHHIHVEQTDLNVICDQQGGRFTWLQGIHDSILVDSTYNASPESMKTIIQQTLNFAQEYLPHYRKICVLGQMNELGSQTQAIHTSLVDTWLPKADYIILYGEHMHSYVYNALCQASYPQDRITCAQSLIEIVDQTLSLIQASDQPCLILYKGSQGGNYLEEALKPLLADKADIARLVRQEDRWMTRKLHSMSGI